MKQTLVQTLRAMPGVVQVWDLVRVGHADAGKRLPCLAEEGFLDALGGDLYYTPLSGKPLDLFLAARKAVPAPVIWGPTVLNDFGVITQIPLRLFVLSVGDAPVPEIRGAGHHAHFPRGARAVARGDRVSARGEEVAISASVDAPAHHLGLHAGQGPHLRPARGRPGLGMG